MLQGGERSNSDDEPNSSDDAYHYPGDGGDDDDDDDDDDDESPYPYDQLSEEILRLIEQNDPDIAHLILDNETTWIKGAGFTIGKSMSLKSLYIGLNRDNPWIVELCQGLSQNQSIEEITCVMCDDVPRRCFDYVHLFHPFFEINSNLRSIDFTNSSESDSQQQQSFNSLVSGLSKCKSDKLERITIYWRSYVADNDTLATLFDSLKKKPSLVDLTFRIKKMGTVGYTALANLLKNPSSKIVSLYLGQHINTDCMAIICNGIIMNNTVRKLDLSWIKASSLSSCVSLSTVLFHPMCSLEKLILFGADIRDGGIAFLGDALTTNRTVTHLDLSDNKKITPAGWRVFSQCLRMPDAVLEKLNITQCGIDDEKAEVIFSALAENSSLKTLNMNYNNDFTSVGFVSFFHALLNGKSVLERLSIEDSGIDFDSIADEEWGILSRALCDTSSIDSTYSSNHTFCFCEEFAEMYHSGSDYGRVWDEICALMIWNGSPSGAHVARSKILKFHFYQGNTGVRALRNMDAAILPFALEWMGRDKLGYSPMFDFVQSFPTLFDISHAQLAGSKKRKL